MQALRRFLSNHVLANLTFGLVLIVGLIAYSQMPRAKDPEINFNWINIITVFPGAAAADVERRITDPIEDALRRSLKDVRFVSSTSREGSSNILVRFNQMDERTFDKRLIDLRREVQNTYTDQLPAEAEDPVIYEITTSNSLPSASVVVTGLGQDENLRKQSENVKKGLERIQGVDRVETLGLSDPELHVEFYPDRLVGLGVGPADIVDTVRGYFQDVSAGDLQTRDGQWIVRIQGTDGDPSALADFPLFTAKGVVPLGSLATLSRTTKEPSEIVRYQGQPAVMMTLTKQAETNVLDLIERVNAYIGQRNGISENTGVKLVLVDDQTVSTREALTLMQNNALIGLVLVLLVTWAFLGSRIAMLTSIGIPFTLAGTFLILHIMGMTLNNTVLLGVVISLGMLVDDAVVVVESIYRRLQDGMDAMDAVIDALREVFAPVTTSVLTTMAAFLPLMLLPGILGEFMKVIPIVVTLALAVSLLEAYWMLPVHISVAKIDFKRPSRTQQVRQKATHWIRRRYTVLLLRALRHPIISILGAGTAVVLAIAILAFGGIRFNFFESDALRLFYINAEMPAGYTLQQNADKLVKIEKDVLSAIRPEELRSSVTYAGQMFTETEPLFGDTVGQIMVSLKPATNDGRSMEAVWAAVEAVLAEDPDGARITLFPLKDGPPTARDINVKIRGDDFAEIQAAAQYLLAFLDQRAEFQNAILDYRPGNPELVLRLDGEAIKRAGLNPAVVNRNIQAYVDGQIVSEFQDRGEEVTVRVKPVDGTLSDIDALLRQTLPLPSGGSISIGDLVRAEYGFGQRNIRHYNYRRTIAMEADIDSELVDTVQANNLIKEEWQRVQGEFPNIDLEFSGALDDIQESLDAMLLLAILGVGLIYIILGTQFRSYALPAIVLISVLLAVTGVVFGLVITNNPMSLYTLYGVVALAGISVNAAIVLISAANDRLALGMSVLHATVYAARRRVVPILITTLTTIAGLFSLAAGLAGHSLIWGPVATAIVSGLACASVLTLFVIPLMYRTFMSWVVSRNGRQQIGVDK